MKIAILHYTSWPQPGGVETVIRDQASLLLRFGHEVMVLSGQGEDPKEEYAFGVIPELAPDYPLNAEVTAVLKRGQSDQKFAKYRSLLVETLRTYFSEVDIVLVHNIFTMHFNLALTQALHDLASEFRLVAWTHDLAACSTDYSVPNPTKPPWNLTRTACAKATYVAVSDVRRNEIEAHLKPKPQAIVIPNRLMRFPYRKGIIFFYCPQRTLCHEKISNLRFKLLKQSKNKVVNYWC
jgi:mannosylglucosylglycerate synthase